MLRRPTVFDLSRLVTRLAQSTPTGIDRVDLAYARWLSGLPGERFAALSTPWGPRVLGPDAAAWLLKTLDLRWREGLDPDADPTYRSAADRLGLPLAGAVPKVGADVPDRPPATAWSLRHRARALAGSRGPGVLPPGCVYVHTSHLRLDLPHRFAWLAARPDVRAVFFVHDLIPIDHPEFSREGEDGRHRTRLQTIARHGHRVIVNSSEVKRSLESYWTGLGRSMPPVAVAPLGIEPPFLTERRDEPATPRYFVMCGTIEPRKNHAFLLHVWRRLAEAGGAVPKLVIAGRRGWESESVIDLLERAPFVRDHVVEIAGLSTPGLARLMAGAAAVLMPSFVEGYGLPVAEALSLGTPVIASDIPVHREVAGGHALLLDPLDGPAWMAAIRALSEAPSRPRAEVPYRPPTWEAHFEVAAEVLSSLDEAS